MCESGIRRRVSNNAAVDQLISTIIRFCLENFKFTFQCARGLG